MPKFSVVIPTLNRPDTLKYSMLTILRQTFDDYELVIANNGSNPDVSRLIEEFNSPRIKEVRSDAVLSMSENWERGLDACTGEYVIFVGDDDGLQPDALAYANQIFTLSGAKVMMIDWHYYYWPQTLVSWLRGRLMITGLNAGRSIVTYPSYQSLSQAAAFQMHPLFNPNIYSSFVHRSVIEKCKERLGIYFAHRIPDWFSGIVNLYFTENVVSFTKPLGMRGISRQSNGGGMMTLGGNGKEIVDQFFDERSAGSQSNLGEMDKLYHPLSIMADVFTHAKKVLFNDDQNLNYNYFACVHAVVRDVNRSQGGYHTLVNEARNIARRYGIDISGVDFPQEVVEEKPDLMPHGPIFDADGKCSKIIVDGLGCDVLDVAAAVRLAASIVPG